MIRVVKALLLTGATLAAVGARADIEKGNMLLQFVEVLDAMAYAAAGLCLFAVVWAGFLLIAEGSEERGSGRARSAVALAVTGLVLTLSAKGIALALLKVTATTALSRWEKDNHLKPNLKNSAG